jgi:glycosyltransferase involved in cell wall biosynthesis
VKPFASVIIATRNREALLGRTLDALAEQDWPPDRVEVIVADNGSTDRTRDAVERAARRPGGGAIRYLHVAEPGKSHAVNAAFSHARGDLFALTDDDVRPSREWLTRLLRPFEAEEIDFVAGRIEPDWETPPPHWMSPALYGVLAIPDGGSARLFIRLGVNDHVMPIGANMAVRASVVHRLGGLRTDLGKLEGTLRTGEDHELFLRLLHSGLRGCYEPAAVVSHRVPRERLRRAYFRRWLFQNGQDVAKLQKIYRQPGRRLLKVPRGLWRDAAQAVRRGIGASIAGDPARRFAASVRLIWIAGYLRESWIRVGVHHTAAGDIGVVARHTAPMG